MDSHELQAALHNYITTAQGQIGSELSETRRRAMEYYLGEPLGNEVDGRSQVVSTDVQDVIESVMPDLMQIFTASDRAVRFDPKQPEDEEFSDQATDYVNHIWYNDNDGFVIFHDWIKDALLQINGVIKIWWDATPIKRRHTSTGLTDDQVAQLAGEDGVEIIEATPRPSQAARDYAKRAGYDIDEYDTDDVAAFLQSMGMPPEVVEQTIRAGTEYDVTYVRTNADGRVRVMNVPPEAFLISRRAASIDDAPFVAHWEQRTVSDLVEAGYDREQVESLPQSDAYEFDAERVARFYRDDDWPLEQMRGDPSMREIDVYECYLRVDMDGDGIAELRKVTVAGSGHEILRWADGTEDNEPVDDAPFETITPIRMPHKFYGRSLSDLVEDVQLIKTTLWRQMLDNMYSVNNARLAVSNRVSLDDVLDNRVGAPLRVATDAGDVAGHIMPVPTQSVIQAAMPLMEYTDGIREQRTGVTRYSQGLDADTLNKTATGINQILGRSQMRTLMIAQLMASTGVRRAFRKILQLIVSHQDKARTIRLRNQWVPMDPRSWNADMDVSVNVGLGHGTREQQQAAMGQVMAVIEKIVGYQQGANGPLVYLNNVRNAAAKYLEASGLQSADPYLAELSQEQAMQAAAQPKSNPAFELAQQELQQKAMEAQFDAQTDRDKLALDYQKMLLEHERKLAELGVKNATEQARLDLEAAKVATERALEYRAQSMNAAQREGDDR